MWVDVGHPPGFVLEFLPDFIWNPTFLGANVGHLVGQKPAGGGLALGFKILSTFHASDLYSNTTGNLPELQ